LFTCETLFDLGEKQDRRAALNQKMESPSFWNDPEQAKQTIQDLKALNSVLKPFEALGRQADDLQAHIELSEEAGDDSFDLEIRQAIERAQADLEAFELRSMLGGPNDHCNAYVTVHPGEGGTEACDWAEMLVRMYLMWAESKGYAAAIIDREDGTVAGIQTATVHIKGEYAYGYLRGEQGVHRLVRISPFDSNGRRQTSFASVEVTPEIDESIDIELNDKDLKRDVFRSGGPGGQHQNKTESGVRYTHLPTGVSAESRSERSQHKNDTLALSLLKAKLIRIEEEKREAEFAKAYNEKAEIGFGSQIRSYVLDDRWAKDLRTGHKTGNPFAVLDGKLDPFIDAYLRMKLMASEAKKA
jgi:peptide chain release factor 2